IHPADPGSSHRPVLHHVCRNTRRGGARHHYRSLDGRHAWCRAHADQRFRNYPERPGIPGGAVADSRAHLCLGARHFGRVQSRPGVGVQDHAAGAQLACRGKYHGHAPGRAGVHPRPVDQAGGGDAGARHLYPFAAVDRRQGIRGMKSAMNTKSSVSAHNAKVMNRFELTKRLVGQLKREEAVIGGIGNANFDLWASGQRPQNFYMLGSMGLAIPIALGVAIAQPKRHVIALEGDGSLLMQLGCLATVAERAPKNLTIVIWDNGIYQITGSQPTPGATSADLVAVARGAGITQSVWAADEADFDSLVAAALRDGGPTLIGARIDGKPAVGTTERDPVQIRERFMRGLGVRTDSSR